MCAGFPEQVLQNSAGSKAVWLLGSAHTASRGGLERHCSRVGLAQQTLPGAIPTLSLDICYCRAGQTVGEVNHGHRLGVPMSSRRVLKTF